MKAILVLEDGKVFEGKCFGSQGEVAGELVFNTSMMGYQEIITDPSYYQKLVLMTYPQIGNCGVNKDDIESDSVKVSALIIKEYLGFYSNFRATDSLDNYLKNKKTVGLYDIDTRELTRHLRINGPLNGIISTKNFDFDYLSNELKKYQETKEPDPAGKVSLKAEIIYNNNLQNPKYFITVVDFGIKTSILKHLSAASMKIRIVPSHTSAEKILKENPDAIFLSNGPGDPSLTGYALKEIKKLFNKKPIFGIGLGHQLIAAALGAKNIRLKPGHHGVNYPVRNLETGKTEITSQNHSFIVEKRSLEKIKNTNVKITHINLNDETIEGLSYKDLYVFSVQYHPGTNPVFSEQRYLFKNFAGLIDRFKTRQ